MENITFAAVMLYLQGITSFQVIEWLAVGMLTLGIYWYPYRHIAAPIISFVGCIIIGIVSAKAGVWSVAFLNTWLCGFHINNLIKAIRNNKHG